MQIFISHADLDNEHAKRICDELTAKTSKKFWIDDYDLKPPIADYRKAFHDALGASGAGLLVLSRNITGRANITAEWNFILGVGSPLYIAKIDDIPFAEIDPRLSIIQWIDFTKMGWDVGIETLAALINGEALPPDAPITLRRRVTGKLDPKLTTIRMSGRDADLANVQTLLKKYVTTVTGIGGLGKSRLAAEVVTTSEDIDSVIWHVASDISRADEIVALIREHFGLPAETERADIFAQLGERALVVIDNAESVEAGARRDEYVRVIDEAQRAGARVLLTSRSTWREIPAATSREHKLSSISSEAAQQAARDMAAAFGVDAKLLEPHLEAYVKAARQHPRLIEWGLLQVREERSTVREIIREMEALKSGDSQDALFEMIGQTAQKMADQHGAVMLDSLKKLVVFRGGFTYEAASAILGLGDDEDQLMGILKTLAGWCFVRVNMTIERREIEPLVIEGVTTAFGEDGAAQAAHYEFYRTLAWEHHEKQAYFELDVERDNLEAAWAWTWTVNDGEKAYWLANACEFYLQNRGRYEQHLAWAQQAVGALMHHEDERLKATAQNSLGLAYQAYPLGDRRAHLSHAISAYQSMLSYYTPEREPMDYAMTQNNLGIAYGDLAKLENPQENLQRAIAAFQQALIYRTPDRAPMNYAMTHNNLGTVYQELAKLENPRDNLQRALAAYEQACIYLTPDRAPIYYAMTQYNLGNAYQELAQLENPHENLKRAIDAYQQALIYRTPDRDPRDYATTQNNLGVTYKNLAQLENPHENLKRAMVAYQQALIYLTPDRAPLDYAMTQANLGIVYEMLENIPQALACWREAEIYFRRYGMIEKADQMLVWIAEYGQ